MKLTQKIFEAKNNLGNSKEGKVLMENFTYLTLLRIAGFVFPLITMPYLAKVIGPSGFGKIAFASSIIVWVQTVVNWGFNYTATRDVARCRDDKEQCSAILSSVLWTKMFLMVISLAVVTILVLVIPKFKADADIIYVTFLLIPGHVLFPDWFFQAQEKMKYSSILSFIVKLFFTICVFIFVKEEKDYILQPLLISLGFLFSGGIALYIIFGRWGFRLLRPSMSKIWNSLKYSADIFLNNLAPSLYNSFSTIVLSLVCGPVSTGKLDAGSKLVGIADEFMHIISTVFFPFLARRMDKHSFFERLCLSLATIISVVLFVFAPLAIKIFFTPEFNDSILVMRIMSLSVLFLVMNRTYGSNYLILKGKDRLVRNITLSVSLIGFVSAYPLIRFLGFWGAAINVTMTRGLLGVIMMIYAKKDKRYNHE